MCGKITPTPFSPHGVAGHQHAVARLEQQHGQRVVAGGGVDVPAEAAQHHALAGCQRVRGDEAVAALAGVAEGEGVFVPGLHVGQRGLRAPRCAYPDGRPAARPCRRNGRCAGGYGRCRPAAGPCSRPATRSTASAACFDVAGVDDAGRLPVHTRVLQESQPRSSTCIEGAARSWMTSIARRFAALDTTRLPVFGCCGAM